jgi:hypothetical protein
MMSGSTREAILSAVPGLIKRLFSAGTSGHVPLRDLADHAPINYVSIFSGRV